MPWSNLQKSNQLDILYAYNKLTFRIIYNETFPNNIGVISYGSSKCVRNVKLWVTLKWPWSQEYAEVIEWIKQILPTILVVQVQKSAHCVYLCVRTIIFETIDLWSTYVAQLFTFSLSRWSLVVKVIGQGQSYRITTSDTDAVHWLKSESGVMKTSCSSVAQKQTQIRHYFQLLAT